jgi:acyl-CoA hydrolase
MRFTSDTVLIRELSALADGERRVVVSGNFATPTVALSAVDAALPEYRLFVLNGQPGLPDRPGVTYETPFVGPAVRGHPQLCYIPCRLSLVPRLFAESRRPDLVVLHTTPPVGGKVSLGVEVNILPAAVEAARRHGGRVVAQLNPRMPYVYGDGELPTELIDLAIEAEQPLASPAERSESGLATLIGERVGALIGDGSTLQLGIGAIPDGTLGSLSNRRGLRLWSEMFSDGVLALERAGALDVSTALVSSFLFGSPDLYAWADRNPRVRLLRTEATNDPSRIAAQRAMTSVNAALEVDLYAQANASRVRGRIYSGLGGQTDFIVGALHSAGGQAIVALPSWHPRADVSTVVPVLPGPVTSFQHSWIVSEQGAAAIWPQSEREQTAALIRHVAHPNVRAELAAAAAGRGL